MEEGDEMTKDEASQIERQPGFYWVRDSADKDWYVAEYRLAVYRMGNCWYFCGWDIPVAEDDFHEIGSRIEPPK